MRAHPAAWLLLAAVALFALFPFRYNPATLLGEWTGALLPVTAAQFACLAALVALVVGWRALRSREAGSFRARVRTRLAASPLGQPGAVRDALWLILALSLVLTAHFFVKISIHAVNPRLFDEILAAYDRTLCLGADPARLLASAFEGHPWALHAVDVLYSVLYLLAYLVLVPVLALLLPERRQRLSFGIAYLLLWIFGALLYLALPSWGPVFTDHGAFATALAHMPKTDAVQRELARELYGLLSDPYGIRPTRYGGVAAFPSLHIAVVTVFAWCSKPLGRWIHGMCLALLAGMVLGSMVTGYHYLFDGMAGLVLGTACCLVARRWAGSCPSSPNSDLSPAGGEP